MIYGDNFHEAEISMEERDKGSFLNKVLEMLGPFLLYYVVCNIAFLIIFSLYGAVTEHLGAGAQEYLEEHITAVTQLVNTISMIIAVLPLVPMLRRELGSQATSETGSLTAEKSHKTQSGRRIGHMVLSWLLIMLLAASSSVGLNILLSLTGLVQSSAVYQDVARQQYSVAFVVGALLFGLLSPITEEIVFRGVIYNRMRRYCPTAAAIGLSGLLFGAYHGNLVQGLYGGCMGILLAYTYERLHSFFIPCLFHATANLVVYTLAQNEELHASAFGVQGCIILLTISGICIFMVEKMQHR